MPHLKILKRKESDIAWAAGLFEGEGCFYIQKVGGKWKYPRATVNSTDRDILEKFHQIIGFGHINKNGNGPLRNPKWKQGYAWNCHGYEQTLFVLRAFEPWLGPRRLGRAIEVLRCQD